MIHLSILINAPLVASRICLSSKEGDWGLKSTGNLGVSAICCRRRGPIYWRNAFILSRRVTRSHGNSGVVKTKFTSNLPPHAFGASVRIVNLFSYLPSAITLSNPFYLDALPVQPINSSLPCILWTTSPGYQDGENRRIIPAAMLLYAMHLVLVLVG